MKVAIVYDRVNKWGGAERVLLALHEMFPNAPLYTSVYDKKKAVWASVFPKVISSFLQKIPFAKSNHEFLAPLMPWAFESFDFTGFDLVISVTSEAAKGIKTKPETLHVCYCLTPTRYLWSGYNEYFKDVVFKGLTKPIISYLQKVDKNAAKQPNVMIAISSEVKKRIKKYYGRESEIIFPPVNSSLSYSNGMRIKKYFLVVSRLVSYKKVDIAIKAFNKLEIPLVIVGVGREIRKLKSIAKDNIKFTGKVSDKKLAQIYLGAKALIMPQEEDFGITSVEAQLSGVPVIAYNKGGALDTVIDEKTGILFDSQTSESLMQAVKKFDRISFNKEIIKKNAKRFTKPIFKRRLQKTLIRAYSGRRRGNTSLAEIEK